MNVWKTVVMVRATARNRDMEENVIIDIILKQGDHEERGKSPPGNDY